MRNAEEMQLEKLEIKKNLQSILQNRSWSFSSINLELPDIFAIDDISKCTSISAAKYGLSN